MTDERERVFEYGSSKCRTPVALIRLNYAVELRFGVLEGGWTLNERETLSAGQKLETDRVYAAFPHLSDEDFVSENLEKWLVSVT